MAKSQQQQQANGHPTSAVTSSNPTVTSSGITTDMLAEWKAEVLADVRREIQLAKQDIIEGWWNS